jgi:RHS repeat-associated protein
VPYFSPWLAAILSVNGIGNMSAYTETIGADSSSAGRVFNAANQLLVSVDSEVGTTSFTYDNNGNLVQILPPGVNPGEAGEQVYTFNQRNLLTATRLAPAAVSTIPSLNTFMMGMATVYSKWITATASPSLPPISTATAASPRYWLATTAQPKPTTCWASLLFIRMTVATVRTLLADGLGSVRIEMVGSAIDSATTYEPYGKLLARSGDSGTIYGYTGEQHDAVTGLVYLRARYYNPNLKLFMSRDPFPGWQTVPASQHGYSYVHNNPVNLIDPSGEFVPPLLLVAGGAVVVIGGAALLIYAATRPAASLAPIAPPMPSWLPDDFYLYPGKWLYEVCITVLTRPETEVERQARKHVDNLPFSQQRLVDVLPGPQFPQPNDRDKIIRVRHYSKSIAQIKASQEIVSGISGPFIFVEHPIITPRDIDSIQQTTQSFFRPLDGIGGFVDFNVDLNKWIVGPDPNLSGVTNAKIINPITVDGSVYMRGTSMYFPLDAPNVKPVFYDWKGEVMS